MAGVSGLEPELTESKSAVLPLHYTPTGAASLFRPGFSGSSDQRENHLHQSGDN